MDQYRNEWHHVYADNFYNSVTLTSKLLSQKVRFWGTIRGNQRISDSLKKYETAAWRDIPRKKKGRNYDTDMEKYNVVNNV